MRWRQPRSGEGRSSRIELGLELRDSSELDTQLPLGIAKPLVYGPARFGGGATSNGASRGGRWRGSKTLSLQANSPISRDHMLQNARSAERDIQSGGREGPRMQYARQPMHERTPAAHRGNREQETTTRNRPRVLCKRAQAAVAIAATVIGSGHGSLRRSAAAGRRLRAEDRLSLYIAIRGPDTALRDFPMNMRRMTAIAIGLTIVSAGALRAQTQEPKRRRRPKSR